MGNVLLMLLRDATDRRGMPETAKESHHMPMENFVETNRDRRTLIEIEGRRSLLIAPD